MRASIFTYQIESKPEILLFIILYIFLIFVNIFIDIIKYMFRIPFYHYPDQQHM